MTAPDTSREPVRPWTPRVTVAAVVERAGRLLLVEEEVNGGPRLNQPAGHLEDGESIIDAVARETLEETAWHFRPEALVGVYRWRHPESGETYLRFALCGAVYDHEPGRPLDTGILGVRWLDPAALEQHWNRWRSPLVGRCVKDYLAGHRHPLELLRDVSGP